jgi:hypothetical protein
MRSLLIQISGFPHLSPSHGQNYEMHVSHTVPVPVISGMGRTLDRDRDRRYIDGVAFTVFPKLVPVIVCTNAASTSISPSRAPRYDTNRSWYITSRFRKRMNFRYGSITDYHSVRHANFHPTFLNNPPPPPPGSSAMVNGGLLQGYIEVSRHRNKAFLPCCRGIVSHLLLLLSRTLKLPNRVHTTPNT